MKRCYCQTRSLLKNTRVKRFLACERKRERVSERERESERSKAKGKASVTSYERKLVTHIRDTFYFRLITWLQQHGLAQSVPTLFWACDFSSIVGVSTYLHFHSLSPSFTHMLHSIWFTDVTTLTEKNANNFSLRAQREKNWLHHFLQITFTFSTTSLCDVCRFTFPLIFSSSLFAWKKNFKLEC